MSGVDTYRDQVSTGDIKTDSDKGVKMRNEIPASAKPSTTVALHWSKRRSNSGVRISLMPNGDYGVYNIAPVAGRPTAYLFDRVKTEAEAREIANREWKGQGF